MLYRVMRIFKNAWFSHFADREGITDNDLKEAANRLEVGQTRQPFGDADLGGGVYKMRLARPGEGKSGGYRVIVFFKNEERTFFEYAFAKADRGNISEKELRDLKKRAKINLSLTDEELKNDLKKRNWIEVF